MWLHQMACEDRYPPCGRLQNLGLPGGGRECFIPCNSHKKRKGIRNFLKGFLGRAFEEMQMVQLWPTGQKEFLQTGKNKARDKSVVTRCCQNGVLVDHTSKQPKNHT